MAETLEEEKEGLIDLIVWYRDEYHQRDFGHTKMISKIRQTKDRKDLDLYWKITDEWLEMKGI